MQYFISEHNKLAFYISSSRIVNIATMRKTSDIAHLDTFGILSCSILSCHSRTFGILSCSILSCHIRRKVGTCLLGRRNSGPNFHYKLIREYGLIGFQREKLHFLIAEQLTTTLISHICTCNQLFIHLNLSAIQIG